MNKLFFLVISVFILLQACSRGIINKPQPVSSKTPADYTKHVSDWKLLFNYRALSSKPTILGTRSFQTAYWQDPIRPFLVDLENTSDNSIEEVFRDGLVELATFANVKVKINLPYDPIKSNFIVFHLDRNDYQNLTNLIQATTTYHLEQQQKENPNSRTNNLNNDNAFQILFDSYPDSDYDDLRILITHLSLMAKGVNPNKIKDGNEEALNITSSDLCACFYSEVNRDKEKYSGEQLDKVIIFVPKELDDTLKKRCLYSQMMRGFGQTLGYNAHEDYGSTEKWYFDHATIGLTPPAMLEDLVTVGPSILNQGFGYDYFTLQDKIIVNLRHRYNDSVTALSSDDLNEAIAIMKKTRESLIQD